MRRESYKVRKWLEPPRSFFRSAAAHPTLAADALQRIESERISQIVVTGTDGRFLGFVHLHQLMDAGIR